MSLLRTIRPFEQATIRSRVGRTSQPFTTAAFTVLVRAGAGSRPFRRRHALGESDCSLHIARSFEKTRCPRFLNPSNKALATAPFPSGMVARFPEAPISCSSRKAGLSDGYGPCSTVPAPRVRNTALELARSRITPGHMGTRRCQSKRTRTIGQRPPPVQCCTFCTRRLTDFEVTPIRLTITVQDHHSESRLRSM